MKGFSRLFVVAVSVVTLVLLSAVGVSAGAKTIGSDKAVSSVVALVTGPSNAGSDNGKHLDKEKGLCHPPKKHHKHGTPGHKHHPCGDNDDDSD